MKCNRQGFELIKLCEGLQLRSYRCSAKVWTIGYGHTRGVTEGMVITAEQADSFLLEDLATVERQLERVLPPGLSENQFSALCSLVFNLGIGTYLKSSIHRFIKQGEMSKAAACFTLYVKAGGVVEKGLVRRRLSEMALFNRKGK